MKSIKIAVPTNDGKTIFPKMLGMAKEFFIFKIVSKTKFKLVEIRPNPYEHSMQHLKTLDVYDLLSDCLVIISAHIGRKGVSRLEKRGMELFFKKVNIEEALDYFIKERES